MSSLFDKTEKFVKFNQNQSKEAQIKNVLNPFTRTFIDEQLAKDLGIISNGYYRNCYGGLIPIHIAASQGFIQFSTNDEIEIEYRSKQYPLIAYLSIHQVYDPIQQCMISCRQAIEKKILNLEFFLYTYLNLNMEIHEGFNRGLIIGELRTQTTESKSINYVNEKQDIEYDNLFSSLTNIINSLSEFRNTINIIDECELTSDGFIRHKKTDKSYLLTQAIQCGLVSIKDNSLENHVDDSKNNSMLLNDSTSWDKNGTLTEQEAIPFFSDTFIFDLLTTTTTTTTPNKSIRESQEGALHSTNTKRFFTCDE
ncbi:unnamed protein product [Rotaria magnacalcarata]|uniref:Uncharacterized protein n=2 Tax=Rotaria magnacalcarata TaxID=392030 RepID=A0A817A217_9BILA|nr:unnamed protein product [Rotaria magnacalcarata]CAF2225637.1 unnamed protein product [Rotaria magnacalcarata]CAF2248581.1 unnamed protein product [Rotaria magnacalcarata]CAF3837026.1 unnamed protein product [Rotaria magnacalcarata]CAF3867287.1 unnamed protein product [Rotaria magnacalcarata]